MAITKRGVVVIDAEGKIHASNFEIESDPPQLQSGTRMVLEQALNTIQDALDEYNK